MTNDRSVENAFSLKVRSSGTQYFRSSLVQIFACSQIAVRAKVYGRREYRVILLANTPSVVHCSCTCPSFEGGTLCKHIWATLLEAQTREFFHDSDEPPRFVWQPMSDDDEDWDEDGDVEEDDERHFESLFETKSSWRLALAALGENRNETMLPSSVEGKEQLYTRLSYFERDFVTLRLLARRELKGGRLGKFKELQMGKHSLVTLDEGSRAIAQNILDLVGAAAGYGPSRVDCFRLGKTQLEPMLKTLISEGRLLSQANGDKATALEWQAGEHCAMRLSIENHTRFNYALVCALSHPNGSVRRLAEALGVCADFVFFEDAVWRLDSQGDSALLFELHRQQGSFEFPKSAASEVLETLATNRCAASITVPPELAWNRIETEPEFAVVISKKLENKLTIPVKLECRYGEKLLFLPQAGEVIADGLSRSMFLRDVAKEQHVIEKLASFGLLKDTTGFYQHKGFLWALSHKSLSSFAEACAQNGIKLYVDLQKVTSLKTPRFTVTSGVDWFDLDVATEDDIKLAALIKGAKSGWLELQDGSIAIIPERLRSRLARLESASELTENGFRFYSRQAMIIDALVASMESEVDIDEQFDSIRRKLRQFSIPSNAEAPENFCGTLRGYQKEGLRWLLALSELGLGGILADDMGLGKTVQILALLLHAKNEQKTRVGPALIVVPRSLVTNWQIEGARFAPSLKLLDYSGPNRASLRTELPKADVVFTTYAIMRSDIEYISKQTFSYVILDEAQNIKNASAQTSKAVRLVPAKARLALTGTPIENSLHDLFSLLDFLNPGLVKSSAILTELSSAEARAHDSSSLLHLSKVLRPIILRRTKEQVLKDLPPKVEETLYCELSEAEQTSYDKIRAECRVSLQSRFELEGVERSKIHVLEAILRLRQLACHPALAFKERSKTAGSAKLDLLLEKIEEVTESGHKALVFSSFTSLLDVVSAQLSEQKIEHLTLTGKTTNRQELVDQFQKSEKYKVFLLSLKAGGVGLNLTAADYCFILDPWWNPAVENQAIDRAHRIGQSRTVFSYRMVSRGTIEEKIIELQRRKLSLSDAVLRQDEGFVASLSAEDIDFLLS